MLPKNREPTHPGTMLLKEFLEPLNMSQKIFAEKLGWTYARLNEIVNGHRGVSADSAFADAFNMEPQFWLNLLSFIRSHYIQTMEHLTRMQAAPPLQCNA